MPTQLLDVPPTLSWGSWWTKQRTTSKQGAHILFCGPTQSGKTLLCRFVTRLRSYVVIFGTKPHDASLDEYVAEGYTRIDHWPPTRDDYRRGGWKWKGPEARFILWPVIRERADIRRHAHIYAKCLDDVFIQGGWCVVFDEGLWAAARSGLNLGQAMGDTAYSVASNNVTLHILLQRPANVPPIVWTSVSQALLFHLGRTDDVKELASLGSYDPKSAAMVVKRLNMDPATDYRRPILPARHQFLDLPVRAQSEWAISEVELAESGLYVPKRQVAS